MKLTESRIKEIIKEEMELLEMDEALDPMSIVAGAGIAGALVVIYNWLFPGEEMPAHEVALNNVRQRIKELQIQAMANDPGAHTKRHRPPSPPGQGDMQAIKRKARLKRLRQQYGKTKDI